MTKEKSPKIAILSLTSSALGRARHLVSLKEGAVGLRITITSKGCSGNAYKVDYAFDVSPGDELVEEGGVKIFVDPKAIMFMIGSVMDYQEGVIESGFVFANPNETARCGCGESFAV